MIILLYNSVYMTNIPTINGVLVFSRRDYPTSQSFLPSIALEQRLTPKSHVYVASRDPIASIWRLNPISR